MKTSIYLAASVSALAVLSAHSAQAQEYYYGLAAGTLQLDNLVFPGTSDQVVGSVLGGVTFATQGGLRFGAELETSLLANEVSSPPINDIDNLTRVRGLAGYDFQNFSVFASLGYTWLGGALTGGLDSSAAGVSYGIGADIPISNRVSIRIEALRDDLEITDGGYSGAALDGNSLRLGAIVKF